jgi:predicted transcriptional regulator
MLSVHKVIFNVFMQDIFVGIKKYKRIKYRSRTDVMAAILEATTSGKATRSSIYNKSFLNYERLRSIMSFLIEKSLLKSPAMKIVDFIEQQKKVYTSY